MPVLRELRSLHTSCTPPCITPSCRRTTCTLSLPRGQTVCIDCDRCSCFQEGERKPDFIVLYFRERPLLSCWFVVEMKSRVSHPRTIVEQLQAGAHMIENDPCFRVVQSPHRLVPLLLHEKGIHTADVQIVNSQRVLFHGKPYPIKVARCGVNLTALLP